MSRTVGGVLALLLALPALRAEDKPKDKPTTPQEQYKALLQEHADAMKAFQEAYQKADSPEEKNKVFKDKYPKPEKLAPRFVALAEKNSTDPVALDALLWVVTRGSGEGAKDVSLAKAIELLLRDHIQSDRLGSACPSLSSGIGNEATAFLRALLQKSPNKAVRAEACLALAQRLASQVSLARRLKEDASLVPRAEDAFGKGTLDALLKADPAKVEAECQKAFEELANRYAADMKPEKLAVTMAVMVFNANKGTETFLRTLLEKDARREVQGVACLSLGQALKKRADDTAATDPKAAEKVRRESEQLLQRAADKFADVKADFRGTVGKTAERELFDLRHLSIGKVAPDAEGEDQDGKKFKLSDYRGKVVLLDFWSQF